jgi:SecD/SecF fusion protein
MPSGLSPEGILSSGVGSASDYRRVSPRKSATAGPQGSIMKKYGNKFLLIGLTTLVGFLAFWPPDKKLKTGIDLSGGTILVYELKRDSSGHLPPNFDLDELITALKRRVNPEGVLDIPIRKLGRDRIEIILPKASAEEVEDVKAKMTNVGSLEFRILANRKHDAGIIDRALGKDGLTKLPSTKYVWAKLGEVVNGKAATLSDDRTKLEDPSQSWDKNAYVRSSVSLLLTGKTASGKEVTEPAKIKSNTATTITFTAPTSLATITSYRLEDNPSQITGPPPGSQRPEDEIVREEQIGPGRTVRYLLCNAERPEKTVTGAYLARVYPTQDERLQPAVGFAFDRRGARLFGQLTGDHLPEEEGAFKYRLAILLDGQVQSAPSINSQIKEQGIIEFGRGDTSGNQVALLISILNSGKLPATLNPEPLQEENIGPTLGDDTIAKGVLAITISMFVVPFFMLIYYRFAGLVAVVALVLNMVLLLGSMAALQASFTLPGLAGLALTIGMAVDANVLVFERMREEAERGASMAQQIRNGFNRAWLTIFDSHITIFLSGLVLYFVGTDEVKGFALTLIIGMIWNLFTAVYVSRVIFDYCYDRGWLKKLTMMKMLDKTNIDFIGPRKLCMAISTIVIVLGLVAFFARGISMYNIDFTGGTLVTIRLNDKDPKVASLSESQRSSLVRQTASSDPDLPDVTVESLNVGGTASGARYNIRTTQKDIDKVRTAVLKAFGSTLAQVELTPGEAKPIAAAPAPATDAAKAEASVGPTDRFAGGRQYALTLNRPITATKVSTLFRKVLTDAGVTNPDTRFEVVNPAVSAGSPLGAESSTLLLRTDLDDASVKKDLVLLTDAVKSDRSLLFEQSESIGTTVAGETRVLALIATVASWIIIAGYLWFRFKSFTYGLAAVIAVIHDVLVTLGAVAVTYWLALIPGVREFLLIDQLKIDLPMITAFLTLIGFSVNDTIVIFDRIREIKGKTPNLTPQIINDAVNQTLSRTILTSLTAWLVVVILYIFGGEGLHGFAFALTVGFLSGTYSTIYIASPILIDWMGGKPSPEAAKPQKKAMAGSR